MWVPLPLISIPLSAVPSLQKTVNTWLLDLKQIGVAEQDWVFEIVWDWWQTFKKNNKWPDSAVKCGVILLKQSCAVFMLLYQPKHIRTGFLCVRGHDLTGSISKLCYSGLFPWECQLIFKIQMVLLVGGTALLLHFTQFIPCGLMRWFFQKSLPLCCWGAHTWRRKSGWDLLDHLFHPGSWLTKQILGPPFPEVLM